jgi:hypothetical protein
MATSPAPDRPSDVILAEWKAAQAAVEPSRPDPALLARIDALRAELDAAVQREAPASASAPVADPGHTARELRDTSDELLRDLDVLAALEEEKRTIAPGDPLMVELAARVDEVAQRVLTLTTRQRVMSEGASASAVEHVGVPIDDLPPRPIAAILTDWRAEERRLAAAEPDSADAAEASARIDGLREEYRRAYQLQASRD